MIQILLLFGYLLGVAAAGITISQALWELWMDERYSPPGWKTLLAAVAAALWPLVGLGVMLVFSWEVLKDWWQGAGEEEK